MSELYIGALGGLAFLGAALSCFFVPYLGDKYGRWSVFVITMFLQNALGPTANLCQNLSTLYVVVFYMGMGLIGRFTCGFVLLTEWVPKRHQAIAGTVLTMGDSIATLYVTFFLRYISNDSNTILWIAFAVNVIAFTGSLFLYESPRWLLSQGREEEAMRVMAKVAKMNGKQWDPLTKLKPDDQGLNDDDQHENDGTESEKEQIPQLANNSTDPQDAADPLIEEEMRQGDKLTTKQPVTQ